MKFRPRPILTFAPCEELECGKIEQREEQNIRSYWQKGFHNTYFESKNIVRVGKGALLFLDRQVGMLYGKGSLVPAFVEGLNSRGDIFVGMVRKRKGFTRGQPRLEMEARSPKIYLKLRSRFAKTCTLTNWPKRRRQFPTCLKNGRNV